MYYYQHNIGDYKSDTAHLTLLEHGCYRQLLDWYYKDESPLPRETEVVFRRLSARTEEDKLAIQLVLNDFFELGEKGYSHKRCDAEISTYQQQAERARQNGKLGGRPKKTEVVILANPDVTQTKANQEPITNNHKPVTNNQRVKNTVSANAETAEVFDYWKQKLNHPNSQLDNKRVKAISGRLKDGYTVGQLCQAIDGCKNSRWHQGENDRKTVYDDIELICRDGPNVDRFIGLANKIEDPFEGLSKAGRQTALNGQQWLEEMNARQ